jgi:hypothetical protein
MTKEQKKEIVYTKIPKDGTVIVSGEEPKGFFYMTKKYETKCRNEWKKVAQKAKKLYWEILDERGISGQHKLLSKAKVDRGIWGNVDGEWQMNQFLFFKNASGKISANVRTAPSIQFAWSPQKDQVILTELPLDKVVFKADENIDSPDIDFDLDPTKIVKKSDNQMYTLEIKVHSNPNDYVKQENLLKAVIRFPRNEIASLKLLPVDLVE